MEVFFYVLRILLLFYKLRSELCTWFKSSSNSESPTYILNCAPIRLRLDQQIYASSSSPPPAAAALWAARFLATRPGLPWP